ncbi:GNAT family N-acetyltransferase [Candidatus Pacearchaeota archaeon]|nr:GNAT family N-acetyltransferase [Candidatus Pacearchaeota archaeon]MBI2057174.1 GNAT family N-acetyltransferase [Candidatus Pacearchaeota archaeon]
MKLETKRLILRKPEKSDWKDLVDGIGKLEVSKWTVRIPYPYKKKDAIDFINKSLQNWGTKSYNFFIELKAEKKMIGSISLEELNKFNGTATTGSWINKKYWRKGYITEAKIAINNFAFNKLRLRKLKSSVFIENKASNITQRRMGYKLEGISRKDAKSKATGIIHDHYIYGLLKEDWKKTKFKLNKKREKI